jgi:hypothetical protein
MRVFPTSLKKSKNRCSSLHQQVRVVKSIFQMISKLWTILIESLTILRINRRTWPLLALKTMLLSDPISLNLKLKKIHYKANSQLGFNIESTMSKII